MKYFRLEDIPIFDADRYIMESFRIYGIEGTEQKIKEVYAPGTLQKFMLARYRKILNGKTQETET